jgi:apurinic endonuclease APN1
MSKTSSEKLIEIKYNKRINAGTSVPFQKNIHDTLIYSNTKGYYSIQFFLGSYISLKRSNINDNDIYLSNLYLKKYKFNIFTHLPYIHNLCGKSGYLENENKDSLLHTNECKKSIIYELNIISKVIKDTKTKGGCVLHIGSIGKNTDINKREKALNIVIKNINEILNDIEEGNSYLILETMVGNAGVIGNTFDELKFIYDKIDKKDRIGICIDTCHIFAEGLYKLNNKEEIDKMFNDYFSKFPKDSLQLIHLNDSKYEFKCKKDRHENLLKGNIWVKDTLYYFIDKLEELNIPYVLETDEIDYDLLQN